MESETFFRLHWNCGKIILQSPNGRFLGVSSSGVLVAHATIPGELDSLPTSYFMSESWNVTEWWG